MALRRSSLAMGVIGIVLIVASFLVAFVAAPILTKLPGSTNVKLNYTGTANLLNAKALQTGSSNVFLKNVPTTITRQIKVTSTNSNTAIVTDDVNLDAGGTTTPNDHTYAIDRTSLKTVTSPNGTKVEPTTGCLAVSFPLNPKPDNSYTLYDASTQKCFPLKYTGKTNRGGRSVYAYTTTETGALKDQNLLKGLPQALPKKTLASLAPLLPAALRTQVAPALGSLPNPVPLTYQAVTKVGVWADTKTGLPIDETLNEQVIVGLTVGGKSISLLPALAVNVKLTPASIKKDASKATSAGRLILIVEVIAPIVLGVIGLALLAVAYLRRRPKSRGGSDRADSSRPMPDSVGSSTT